MKDITRRKPLLQETYEAPQEWQEAVLERLRRGGPVCQHAAAYIARHGVRLRFRKQSTGARWTAGGDIELNPLCYPPQSDPTDPGLLGAIVHEATHLEQGPAMALSVEGEVGGWRAEFLARSELNAPIEDECWRAVASTPTSPTKQDLLRARSKMIEMAGRRYLVWLLPLRANRLTALAAWIAGRVRRRG